LEQSATVPLPENDVRFGEMLAEPSDVR